MAIPETLTVYITIQAPIETVWEYWTQPEHIVKWAFASDTWEAPAAENDLRVGGRFKTIMAAKDKSASFEFSGTYTQVIENELIEYDMDPDPTGADGSEGQSRHVKIEFKEIPEGIRIVQTFIAEAINPLETQRSGWQAILENFKKCVETDV